MKKIDKNYIPKISYGQTVRYCNDFVKHFLELVNQKYKLVEISLPMVTTFNSPLSKMYKGRKVSFDNNENYQIYELIPDYDGLFRYNFFHSDLLESEALFSKIRVINRDRYITPFNRVDKTFFCFEIPVVEEQRSIDTCKEIMKTFWNWIIEVAKTLDYSNKDVFKKVQQTSLKKIIYAHLFAKKMDAIERFIQDKKMAIVSNDENNFPNVFRFKSIDSYDFNNTVSLFVWSSETNQVLEVLDTTFRPNGVILDKQLSKASNLKENDDFIKNNEFYKIIRSGNYKPSVCVKVFIDRLFYFLLSKNYISELPSYHDTYNLEKEYDLYKLKKLK